MTNQKPPVDIEPIAPTTCPHCGAPHRSGHLFWMDWHCGTQAMRVETSEAWTLDQSPECARYVRTRISQLKRMAERADALLVSLHRFAWNIRRSYRMANFKDACLREIDRLRGQG